MDFRDIFACCSSFFDPNFVHTYATIFGDAHHISFQKWRLGQQTEDILVHGFAFRPQVNELKNDD